MTLLQKIEPSNYHYQPTWVMIIVVISLLVIGYLYSAFNSRFSLFIKAVFLSRYSVQASREERALSHPVSLLLSLNFVLTASLFILQLISSGIFFDIVREFSLPSYLFIALGIVCVYLVKILFLRILAFIIDKEEVIYEYNFAIFLVNQFLGIALLPAIVFIAYGPTSLVKPFVFSGAALFAIGFLVRVGKGLAAALDRREASLFYLILYLCTLEILPLLIGVKLVEGLIS